MAVFALLPDNPLIVFFTPGVAFGFFHELLNSASRFVDASEYDLTGRSGFFWYTFCFFMADRAVHQAVWYFGAEREPPFSVYLLRRRERWRSRWRNLSGFEGQSFFLTRLSGYHVITVWLYLGSFAYYERSWPSGIRTGLCIWVRI